MEQVLYNLPDEWEWRDLLSISYLITDGTHHSPKKQYEEYEDNRYKYLTSKNVKNDGLKLENITYIDKNVHEDIFSRCNPEYLDQLITKDGAMTGTCCLNTLNEPFSLLSSVALIKQKRELVIPEYLNYYLQSSIGQEFLLGDISGAAITRTNLKKLKKIPIPLPTIQKQNNIVEKLNVLLSRIKKTVNHLEECLELSKKLILSSLDSEFSAIINRKIISELAEVKGGKRLPKGKKLSEIPTKYPYIRVSDFTDKGTIELSKIKYISKDVHQQIKRYIISSDDLYISIAGTIGKTGFVPPELNHANLTENAAKLVIKDKSELNLRYLYLFTQSSDFKEQVNLATKQVAQPKLALTRLSKIEIPVCHYEQQEQIIKRVELLKNKLHDYDEKIEKKINYLLLLKLSILDSAFKGQL